MLTVELKNLHKETGAAASFLQSKIEGKLKIKGTQIQVEGAKAKDVKLLLHKFLHHRGLDGYRVLSQAGILEVHPPEEHRHGGKIGRTEETSLSPYSPYRSSLSSYIYPNYPPPPQRKYKKGKP